MKGSGVNVRKNTIERRRNQEGDEMRSEEERD